MSYSIVFYRNSREVSVGAASWSAAYSKASHYAIREERPFPIIIKDDLGRIILEIKG